MSIAPPIAAIIGMRPAAIIGKVAARADRMNPPSSRPAPEHMMLLVIFHPNPEALISTKVEFLVKRLTNNDSFGNLDGVLFVFGGNPTSLRSRNKTAARPLIEPLRTGARA
jgi:hypothetical protein